MDWASQYFQTQGEKDMIEIFKGPNCKNIWELSHWNASLLEMTLKIEATVVSDLFAALPEPRMFYKK